MRHDHKTSGGQMSKYHEYRRVKITCFREPDSGAWFYQFPFEWVTYRASAGFKDYSSAREAAELHADKQLAGGK
jgi:hypothetical protein